VLLFPGFRGKVRDRSSAAAVSPLTGLSSKENYDAEESPVCRHVFGCPLRQRDVCPADAEDAGHDGGLRKHMLRHRSLRGALLYLSQIQRQYHGHLHDEVSEQPKENRYMVKKIVTAALFLSVLSASALSAHQLRKTFAGLAACGTTCTNNSQCGRPCTCFIFSGTSGNCQPEGPSQ